MTSYSGAPFMSKYSYSGSSHQDVWWTRSQSKGQSFDTMKEVLRKSCKACHDGSDLNRNTENWKLEWRASWNNNLLIPFEGASTTNLK